ncbi:pilus assembly protein PilM [Chloroflexota bacterium]
MTKGMTAKLKGYVSRARKALDERLANRVVTLDIGSSSINLMEARGEKVVKWASLSLEPGVIIEGVIANPRTFAGSIKQLMSSSGMKKKSVIASVTGLYSITRIVTLVVQPGQAITSEAVMEALRGILPMPPERLYLSWQTVSVAEGSHRILVAGVPREIIDAAMQALKLAGVSPSLLDLKGLALARIVNKNQAVLLNLEPYSFDIVLMVNSVPEIVRTIPWPQDELDVSGRSDYLALNLRLMTSFYDSKHPAAPLESDIPLLLTGQMSGDVDLVQELQKKVNHSIELPVPPLEYPQHLPVSQYAANIGLTLKRSAQPKQKGRERSRLSDIDLLPDAYKPWRPSLRQVASVLFTLVILFMLFPAYEVTMSAMARTADLETQYQILNNRLELRKQGLDSQIPLKRAVSEYKSIQNMRHDFTEDLVVIHEEARELAIVVLSIMHEGEGITVDCSAESYVSFRDYLAALEKSVRFATAIPPPEGYPYTTSGAIELEPGEPET